jgi:glycogen operon protein
MQDFAARFTGSGDIYDLRGRRPWAGVNFLTAHDGFTLNDLVSYNHKHNEANGEDNRDGHSDNRSFNHGVEGPTDDPGINAVRDRQRRNLLATLFLSHGTPMLLAGDETGRSQMGNNNGYCQDNELSWIHWENLPHTARALTDFVRRLTFIRRTQPLLHRDSWRDMMSVTWLNPGGGEQTEEHWSDEGATTIGLRLSRDDLKNREGAWWELMVIFNPHDGPVDFALPRRDDGRPWTITLDTNAPDARPKAAPKARPLRMPPRSLRLLT